jgi:putative hydrolase of the HAD superfamily
VISNAGDDADVQHLVDKIGVRSCLDFVITSAACGIRKPDPQIFQIALDHWDFLPGQVAMHWDFLPGQVAMVGDTLNADVLGGQNSGLYTVWVTRRADTTANRAHQDAIRPDAVIDTLAELPGLLAVRAAAFAAALDV